MNAGRPWTEAESDTLQDMWKDGYSPSQIGERLGRSADSVGRRAKRMKLAPRSGFVLRYTSTGAMCDGGQPKPPTHRKPHPLTPAPVGLSGLRLMTCRFPVGEETGEAQLYCGGLRERGAYCQTHAKVAYVEGRR